jgi:acyl-CoA thioesterase FadM
MRLRIRILYVIFRYFIARNTGSTKQSSLWFFVWPLDCVIKLMGNDRYHAFMDCGRIELLLRHLTWPFICKNKIHPAVYSCHIIHRKPLKLFCSFNLRTRMVHCDNKFFWIEHQFYQKGEVVALAISKNCLTSKNRIIPPWCIFALHKNELIKDSYPADQSMVKEIDTFLTKRARFLNNKKTPHESFS